MFDPETHYLAPNTHAPNSVYPVLVYRQALPQPDSEESATAFLEAHAWTKRGTWGHIDVRHFHPNVHECYGVVAGSSTMLVGCGSDDDPATGTPIPLATGDVIVLPAGTGHCNVGGSSTDDYLYVGLYPTDGPHWRFELGKEGMDMVAIREEVASVALPAQDPVSGVDGPLLKLWVKKEE